MWWPRPGSYEKRPTPARLRILIPIAALGALVIFGEPGVMLMALIPQDGPVVNLPEYTGAIASYSPFNSAMLASIAPLLVGALVLSLIAGWFADRTEVAAKAINVRPPDALLQGERGVSAIEFMLLLPFLLMIMLTILQIALIIQAKFIVNYAAFCAVRAAVVTIPANLSPDSNGEGGDVETSEAKNAIDMSKDDGKLMIVKSAAQLPCIAVSPSVGPGNAVQMAVAIGEPGGIPSLASLINTSFLKLAPWALTSQDDIDSTAMLTQFGTRAIYSYYGSNTTVEIEGGTKNGDTITFGEFDPITVTVTHRYFLAVPFGSRFLGTKFWDDAGIFGFVGRSGYYYPISERYTLLNEGQQTSSGEDIGD